jgi:transcription-repair coupling factor (superfamily II helicase)
MNVETFNYSFESLAPFFYLNKRNKKNLYVFSTEREALEFYNNFSNFVPESSHFPAWDTLSYDSFTPSLEIQGKRLQTLHNILVNDSFDVVMSMKSFTQKIFINDLDVIDLQVSQDVDFENLIENLTYLGYVNKDRVESRGTFSIRGGQIDIYPLNSEYPVRILFNGDEVAELKLFDYISQRSIKNIQKVLITPSSELFQTNQEDIYKSLEIESKKDLDEYELFQFSQNLENFKTLLDFVPDKLSINIIDFNVCKETFSEIQKTEEDSFNNLQKFFSLNISKMKSRYVDTFTEIDKYETTFYATNDLENISNVPQFLNGLSADNVLQKINLAKVYLFSSNEKIREKFSGINNLEIVEHPFSYSAMFPEMNIAVIDESLFTNRKQKNKKVKHRKLNEESILVPNTYVVHKFHGIGLYEGTEVKKIKDVDKDYLSIKFGGTDRLYVPSDQINELEVYVGGENPRLSRLGGGEWERAKEKAKQNAKVIADRVLNLYKLRKIENNSLIIDEDTPWQTEIESDFEYVETPDQLTAINEVKEDLGKNTPMDRLIFGDVGYGKTEVALRAAVKVAFSGGQVAVLAPTTILVQQHIETFVNRLENYPLNIKHLSRFVKKKDLKEIIKGVNDGTVDIVIGTHRLLSDDVTFNNLKLIVIDEEHRFGVEAKDRLQNLASQVHKLTLTATPIPRTLEQSLMGIRETSRIETPPENRLETLTHVGSVDESAIALAIQREISRGGQVFFVLNRISELEEWMKIVSKQFTNLNHKILHGQLSSEQIENTMQDVWDRKVDVLYATTIVEAGIDLPKVNTLITLRSELLGMSQLYQLKGRVGRRGDQSFAYFFHSSNLGIDAELRLDAIKSIGQTATGYSLAMKDLQLRGSGSILGDIQSGFIANVGLNIFNQYVLESLDESIETVKPSIKPDIKLDCYWGSSIPKNYVDADSERIDIYKRLEHTHHTKVDHVKDEIIDRFGELPEVSNNLFTTAKIRSVLSEKNILRCKITEFQIELFPIDLTEEINLRMKTLDKKFIFRNKRLVLNFKNALSPDSVYQLLNSNL